MRFRLFPDLSGFFLLSRTAAAALALAAVFACAPLSAWASPDESGAELHADVADPLEELISSDTEIIVPPPVELGPVPEKDRRRYGLKFADAARSQIGTPYKLGRSAPGQGFDCSGLVWWVYRQHGITLPRVSTLQATVGRSVPLSEAHPGDIVVFRTGRGPNGLHTGIITDPGHFIHAPRAGKRVQETAIKGYWSNRLLTVRRVRGLQMPEKMPSADEINAVLEELPPEAVTAATAADPLYDAVSSSTPKITRLGPAPAAKPAALHASVRKGQPKARAAAAAARGKKPASAKRAAAAPAKGAKAKVSKASHEAAPKAAKTKHSGKPAASQAKAAPAKKKQERKAKR